MFIFGHIGIGRKVASPWSRGLPFWPLVLGMLLPDLIDKTAFYSLRFLGITDTIIDGTRTFGHTALFLLLILGISGLTKSKNLLAIALGMATHLLLDNVSDRLHDVFNPGGPSSHSAANALLWPLLGTRFAPFPFHSMGEHLGASLQPEILIAELIGLLLIGWDYWKTENRVELRKFIFSRRYRKLRRYRRGLD
jgi:hypothetical protein